MAREDLIPVRSTEEAKARGRNGGKKSGEVRRAKKTMREIAKSLMQSGVSKEMTSVTDTLKRLGIERTEQTYSAAVVARILLKAMEGDVQAARMIAEMTGDVQQFGTYLEDEDVVDMKYPAIIIPSNGRDEKPTNAIGPQAGPQTQFMCSPADIVIYGGAAGGGKTYALLMEPLRHIDVPGYGGTIFRKNFTQITSQGGLWETSMDLFSRVEGAEERHSPKLHWRFNGGKAKLNFAHLEREDDLKSWQGSQICYIGFDELTHFTKHQFLYMLSRNRSTCGVKPYVRATCNPDVDSWVAELIAWWIDQDTGYPIPERSGQLRYMVTLNDTIHMADTKQELCEKFDVMEEDVKSFTFIASRLQDNKILMKADPGYMANLKAMTEVDMERLLYGNWKIKPKAGLMFKRTQVKVDNLRFQKGEIVCLCRGWDLAATTEDENGDAAYTASVLMARLKDDTIAVLDVTNDRLSAGEVLDHIINTAKGDKAKWGHVRTRIPQDPGQAGKSQAQSFIKAMKGFDVVAMPESGDKVTRATPYAAQWQHGFVVLQEGEWNNDYFSQLESFPDGKYKDMVDASSSAFDEITNNMIFNIDNMI